MPHAVNLNKRPTDSLEMYWSDEIITVLCFHNKWKLVFHIDNVVATPDPKGKINATESGAVLK